MKSILLSEFIAYAKEKYDYTIKAEETSASDSFESIFGVSFLKQEADYYFPEGECIGFEYVNEKIEPKIDFSKVITGNDFSDQINFAA